MIKIRQTIILNIAAAVVTLAFTHGSSIVPVAPHVLAQHMDDRRTNPHVMIAPATCRTRRGC